jgi:hypothetical protein
MANFKNIYIKKYDTNFFHFDKNQFEIPPSETLQDLNNYSAQEQQNEILKCSQSFSYFCHKYVKILHPTKGLIPFIIYKYQKKCIDQYEKSRFNIISKFRQGGLTTVTLLYGMWRCMFRLDQQIMLLSKTDREATVIGMMVDRAVEYLPEWLKPNKDSGKWNDHLKQFTETGGNMMFYSPEAARGKAVTFLIIDEAAFIPDMDTHWKAMWPVLSTGGSCVVISTVNGVGNWYEETYYSANQKKNMFNVIDLDYWEHPDYNDSKNPEWAKEQKSQLGERGFLQEVLRVFLGSGETYISSNKLTELDKTTKNRSPYKKILPNWANRSDIAENEIEKGALWIWREPIDGQEYIMGIDSAEGIGDGGDNSCLQIINQNTLEQVAEFYSNNIPTHELTQIAKEIASFYNKALIVVEDMSTGGAILNALQHEYYYENLYYGNAATSKNPKPGVKITVQNRPIILQSFQQKIYNDTLKINSTRLVNELKTFEYNVVAKKAQAQRGKHDDAIMAMGLALHARDNTISDLSAFNTKSESNKIIKSQTINQLREELKASLNREDLFVNDDVNFDDNTGDLDEETKEMLINKYRNKNDILKEFGW